MMYIFFFFVLIKERIQFLTFNQKCKKIKYKKKMNSEFGFRYICISFFLISQILNRQVILYDKSKILIILNILEKN